LIAFAALGQAQLLPPGVPNTSPSSATRAPAAETPPDTVVVSIAGISVTAGDVQNLMRYAPPNLQQLYQQNPLQAISTAYQMKFLAEEAQKLHLDQQDPTKETLEAVLAWQTENILAGAMVNEVSNGYKVTLDQIDEFYRKNQSRWQEAKIKIIAIGFKPDCKEEKGQAVDEKLEQAAKCQLSAANALNERSLAEARQLTAGIVKLAREGANFAALVAKYSEDKESKALGGDFGVSIKTTSDYAPEIKKVVFGMKKGEISDPVQEAYSLYIIRLEEISTQPEDQLIPSIAQELRDSHRNDYLTDLSKRFTPQVIKPEFFVHAAPAPKQ